ncbi:MAG: host specificity factor TipJ family phage tail protein [Aeromonadaceae bacterium]
MILVCHDPAMASFERHKIDHAKTWRDNLFALFPYGLDARDWELMLNDKVIEPERLNLDTFPLPCDRLIMRNRPLGVESLVIGLIAVAASVAVSFLFKPDPFGYDETTSKSSNNSFSGQTNAPRAYQAQPDIFGRVRAYPDIVSPAVVEYVDNNRTLKHYFWLSRGSIEVSDVRYADTDIGDYTNSQYFVYDNSPIQTVIEQFANAAVDNNIIIGVNEGVGTGNAFTEPVQSGQVDSGGDIDFIVNETASVITVYNDFVAGNVSAKVTYSYTNPFGGQSTVDTTGTIQSVTAIPPVLPETITKYQFVISTSSSGAIFGADLDGNVSVETLEKITVGPFTMPVDSEQIWYNVTFVRGLKGRADFEAEWWAIDGNGDEIAGSRQSETFFYEGDTADQKYFTRKLTPAYGLARYRFQIKRTNDANIENYLDQATLESLFSVRIKTNVLYQINGIGGTAIVVESTATDTSTSSGQLKFNCIAERKVITANGDGTINNTLTKSRRICDSVAHHMIVDGGVSPSKIDLKGLVDIQNSITPASFGYFDYTFDDVNVPLGDRITTMCDVGRILVNREGSKYVFVRDEAQSAPVAVFDRRTTAGDEYNLTISPTNTDGKDCVQVEWVDVDDSNTKRYINVSWDSALNKPKHGYGINARKVTLNGCSSYEQALDRAELEMRKLVYQREYVTDTALNDAEYTWRGDRVRWIDVADVGVSSGEIVGYDAANGIYYTSEECDFSDELAQYKVAITDQYGYASAFVTATEVAGKNKAFQAGAGAPIIADGITTQLGSRFFLVKSTEVDRHDFILASKRPNGDGTFSIELVQYDSRIYERTLTS